MNSNVRICFFSCPRTWKKDAGPSFPWRPELLHRRLQVKRDSSAKLHICCPASLEISNCQRFAGHLTGGVGRVNAYLSDPLILPIWGVHQPTRTAYIPLAEPLCAWQQLHELKWPSEVWLPYLCSPCTPNCSPPSSQAWHRTEHRAVRLCGGANAVKEEQRQEMKPLFSSVPIWMPSCPQAHTHAPKFVWRGYPRTGNKIHSMCNQGSLSEWVISYCICTSANWGGNQAIIF